MHVLKLLGELPLSSTPRQCHTKMPGSGAILQTLVIGAVARIAFSLQSNLRITLDGTTALHEYEGHGALSAGASSRLLWDYMEPQRSEVCSQLMRLYWSHRAACRGIGCLPGCSVSHDRSPCADLGLSIQAEFWWFSPYAEGRDRR